MGLDAMIFIFWMLSLKPTFSLSTFTFIKRLLSSSSLSAIRVVSSAYLRLLIFLSAILIPACADYPRNFIELKSYSTCLLVIGFIMYNDFKVHSCYEMNHIFPSILRLNNILLYVGTTFCLSIHFLMNTVASNFALLWIMLYWIGVYSVWDLAFISLRYVPRSGISGSYGNSMINFLRNCQ